MMFYGHGPHQVGVSWMHMVANMEANRYEVHMMTQMSPTASSL